MNLDNLRRFLKRNNKNFIVIGIGNRLRSDDGAGSIFAEDMGRSFPERFIDAGVSVENFIFKIARRPEKVVFVVDAIDFEGEAGEIKIFELNDLRGEGISTHSLGIRESLRLLEASGKRVYVIGIRPEKITLGEEITDNIRKAIETLKGVFEGCMN